MDHDADTESQVILSRAWDNERRPHCLKRSWREHDPGLLIAAIDDVPVDLNNSHIESVVQLEVEPATESHREAGLICVKVADAKDQRKLWTIDVKFLNSDSE